MKHDLLIVPLGKNREDGTVTEPGAVATGCCHSTVEFMIRSLPLPVLYRGITPTA